MNYTKPDVVCGTESWLNKDIKSSEIFPTNDYQVFRKDRDSLGGGVFTLVKSNLIAVEVNELDTNCEIIWVKISLKRAKEIYISTFYMPHRNLDTLIEFERSLEKANPKGKRNLIICGDFNCPDINWNFGYCYEHAQNKNVQDKLIDISVDYSLSQLQEEPTRLDSILDLTFTANPSLIRNLNNIPGIADHEAVIIDSYIRPTFSIQKKKKVYTFNKADWPSLNDYCKKLSDSIKIRAEMNYNIFDLWDLFRNTLNLGITRHIPSKYVKKRSSLPWFDKKLKKLVKKKTKLFKQAKASGDWTTYKEHQKVCKKEFQAAENNFVNNTINN